MKRLIPSSFLSGVLVTIGCTAFLSCDSEYIGAILFTVALCSICNLGLSLYTGAICFLTKLQELKNLAVCLVGNVLGCFIAGSLIRFSVPSVVYKATEITSNKLDHTVLQIFVLAILCGMLMYIAVQTFRSQVGIGQYVGIFTCIPVFIICGFEHSIANIAYFTIAGRQLGIDTVVFIILLIVGNSLGGILCRKAHLYTE